MRKRRRAKKNLENPNISENINQNLNLPCESPKVELGPKEPSLPDHSKLKDADIDAIIKCEADFFCEVIRRLSKEINCARGLDDLEDIISLAAKFLQASADKEKAMACQIAASKAVHKNPNCICDLDDNVGAIK